MEPLDFDFGDLIAVGGQGMLSNVFDRNFAPPRRMVLKEVNYLYASDPCSLARLEDEANIMASLGDTRIPDVYSIGSYSNGRPYFTMRYVNGQTFATLISKTDRGKNDFERVVRKRLRLLIEVCGGLASAHDKGYVHCDIKPSNIMVSIRSEVFIIDWGLGCKIKDDVLKWPRGARVGTPGYMAPEIQDIHLGPADHRVDIYSLGIVLYEMLCGSTPSAITKTFPSVDPRRAAEEKKGEAVRQKSLEYSAFENCAVLRRLQSWVSPALESIVRRAIALRPDDRYLSMADMADDIQRYLDGMCPDAHAETVWETTVRTVASRPKSALGVFGSVVVVFTVVLFLFAELKFAEAELAEALKNSQTEVDVFHHSIVKSNRRLLDLVDPNLQKDGGNLDVRVAVLDSKIVQLESLTRNHLNAEWSDSDVKRDLIRTRLALASVLSVLPASRREGRDAATEFDVTLAMAKQLYKRSRSEQDRRLLALVMHRIGKRQSAQGQRKEAHRKLKKAEKLYGVGAVPARLSSDLGRSLTNMGRDNDALPYCEEALFQVVRRLEEHPVDVGLLKQAQGHANNVAMVLSRMGNHKESLRRMQEAIRYAERQFALGGQTVRDTAETLRMYGELNVIARRAGDEAVAAESLTIAMEMFEDKDARDIPDT